jgi:hypothetical protein
MNANVKFAFFLKSKTNKGGKKPHTSLQHYTTQGKASLYLATGLSIVALIIRKKAGTCPSAC